MTASALSTLPPCYRCHGPVQDCYRRYRSHGTRCCSSCDHGTRAFHRRDPRPRPTIGNFPEAWTNDGLSRHMSDTKRTLAWLLGHHQGSVAGRHSARAEVGQEIRRLTDGLLDSEGYGAAPTDTIPTVPQPRQEATA